MAIATAIAVPAEGLRQWAYYDPVGILTTCYGSTTNVEKERYYPIEECKARLDSDMLKAIDAVERCAPGLPVPTLAAFADAVYNIGPRVACDQRTSTAARLLAAGQIEAACRQLPRWNKAKVMGFLVELPGLTTRRHKEMGICLTGIGY